MLSEPAKEHDSDSAATTTSSVPNASIPRMYRAMVADNGSPIVGKVRNHLGARVPPNNPHDISPDAAGNIAPGRGGMSVNPSLSTMMMAHVPLRWREEDPKFKAARGEEPVEVFRMGDAAFTNSRVAADLLLVPDNPRSGLVKHGVVEPDRKMPENDYQNALAATKSHWELLTVPDGS